MSLLTNKKVWAFVGGVVTTVATQNFVKSKTARDLAVKGLANGMRIKDEASESFETIKEDAKDIYYEAKVKNKETK
ncbi:MAG: DUF6110 family protein [Erysipelotrichaceae bacterium]|nr:DUF6110 family protein [Erysipelotrichaceae bacterium]